MLSKIARDSEIEVRMRRGLYSIWTDFIFFVYLVHMKFNVI